MTHVPDTKLRDAIKAYGLVTESILIAIEVSHLPGMPTLPRCLALLENESGGRNIFGHEGTACPSEWRGGFVTRERYAAYRVNLRKGLTPNGVGPCQLTDPSLLEAGSWRPRENMTTGFRYLHQQIEEGGGVKAGFGRYNGGPGWQDVEAARAYAALGMTRSAWWMERLRPYKPY